MVGVLTVELSEDGNGESTNGLLMVLHNTTVIARSVYKCQPWWPKQWHTHSDNGMQDVGSSTCPIHVTSSQMESCHSGNSEWNGASSQFSPLQPSLQTWRSKGRGKGPQWDFQECAGIISDASIGIVRVGGHHSGEEINELPWGTPFFRRWTHIQSYQGNFYMRERGQARASCSGWFKCQGHKRGGFCDWCKDSMVTCLPGAKDVTSHLA